jgi:two-component system, response regulator
MVVKPEQVILLVEDSPEDYEATVRTLKKSGLANPIVRCENGESALDYLYHRGAFAGNHAPRPNLILLDLDLPGIDGREVLAQVKNDPELKTIPVVVFTISNDEHEVEKCYKAGANGYVKKPVDLDGFVKAIHRLTNYWFEIVVLPKPAH